MLFNSNDDVCKDKNGLDLTQENQQISKTCYTTVAKSRKNLCELREVPSRRKGIDSLAIEMKDVSDSNCLFKRFLTIAGMKNKDRSLFFSVKRRRRCQTFIMLI